MTRVLTGLLAAAVAGALFVAAPLVAAPKGAAGYNTSDLTYAEGCGDGNVLAINAPEKLWPPNHKYYEDIHAVATGAEGEAITLTTTGWHDQYAEDGTELNGSGNTTRDIYVDDHEADWITTDDDDPDPQVIAVEHGTGEVQTDWAARAERSGRDMEGRTYQLRADAQFGDDSCSVTAAFTVPHDMRPSKR